ncbi:hypothetical protein ACS0TY_012190 [Phlomoides rotata]
MEGQADAKKGKAVRSRRSWTKIEEDALIQCLTDIVNGGWKADNGFKARFQRELEKGMKKLLPGTDLVANPHIKSKIHVWKKDYSALSDLLSKSGIGWMILLIPLMCSIKTCGGPEKDREIGEHDVDPMDIVNDFFNTKSAPSINPSTNPVEGFAENTSTSLPREFEEHTSKGKKRKLIDTELGAFIDTIGELIKSTDQTFGTLAQRIDTNPDEKVARKSLNDIVSGIPGISLQAKLKVCDDLVHDSK